MAAKANIRTMRDDFSTSVQHDNAKLYLPIVLLRHAKLLVANDAGTRHIAAAFGVPSVIFFGPTSVAKTPDNLERVEVLEIRNQSHSSAPFPHT